MKVAKRRLIEKMSFERWIQDIKQEFWFEFCNFIVVFPFMLFGLLFWNWTISRSLKYTKQKLWKKICKCLASEIYNKLDIMLKRLLKVPNICCQSKCFGLSPSSVGEMIESRHTKNGTSMHTWKGKQRHAAKYENHCFITRIWQVNLTWAHDPIENKHLVSVQL